MIGTYAARAAQYVRYPGKRYSGNPFVEALGLEDIDDDNLLDMFENLPAKPTAADRRLAVGVRLDEINAIKSIVYARPEYKAAARDLLTCLKDTYVARNDVRPEGSRRREIIARATPGQLILPPNLQSTASGLGVFGLSGSGKTTLANVFSARFRVVIEHETYLGHALRCKQIPWISIRIPHDATLKSLCIQFFRTVDTICVYTAYEKEARNTSGIAEMVLLMAKVVNAISLGVLFVDELQNLRAARGPHIEFVLNLFSQLIEDAGVTVVVAGTPAIEDFLEENVRNIRKLVSGGETRLGPMGLTSSAFADFTEVYWPYQWVKKLGRLTQPIREAWYRASGGNPAFIVMSFMLAQRLEIGGREVLDETSFDRAYATRMALLHPAIGALRSGNQLAMRRFDDLIFTPKFKSLRDMVGWTGATLEGHPKGQRQEPQDEFPELASHDGDAEKPRKRSANKGGGPGNVAKPTALETEDPLLM